MRIYTAIIRIKAESRDKVIDAVMDCVDMNGWFGPNQCEYISHDVIDAGDIRIDAPCREDRLNAPEHQPISGKKIRPYLPDDGISDFCITE